MKKNQLITLARSLGLPLNYPLRGNTPRIANQIESYFSLTFQKIAGMPISKAQYAKYQIIDRAIKSI